MRSAIQIKDELGILIGEQEIWTEFGGGDLSRSSFGEEARM